VPRKIDPHSSHINRRYAAELVELRRNLIENGAVLVYFNRITWRSYLPTAAEIQSVIDIHPLAREIDGVIYGANGTRP
jgi:hypothetical protein